MSILFFTSSVWICVHWILPLWPRMYKGVICLPSRRIRPGDCIVRACYYILPKMREKNSCPKRWRTMDKTRARCTGIDLCRKETIYYYCWSEIENWFLRVPVCSDIVLLAAATYALYPGCVEHNKGYAEGWVPPWMSVITCGTYTTSII